MESNLILNDVSALQCLLYTNFHIKKKYRVDTVAEKMGISSDTLYKWINGTRLFPADRLPSLTIATGDKEYLDFLAGQCGYSIIPKLKDKSTLKMFAHMVEVMQSAIKLKDEE